MRAATFQCETLTADAMREAEPLLRAHWAEVAHYDDIPLDPDVAVYVATQNAGALRYYTIRDTADGSLLGYAVFFVRAHPHYRTTRYAAQDVIFLHAGARGLIGLKFLKWCDAQLQAEGVTVVTQHVKAAHDFGPILLRNGYEVVDIIYAKRLDVARVIDAATSAAYTVEQS